MTTSWLLLALGLSSITLTTAQQPRTVVAPLSRIAQGELFTASMKLGIGSPPQTVTAIFDTGSSDLWVPQAGSSLCNDPRGRCSGTNANDTGAFDSAMSSSFAAAPQPFFANYVNGVEVFGDFMTETVSFGNTTITNNTMGIARNGTLTAPLVSILGVGPASLEASVVNRQGPGYNNLPAHLKAQGQTTSLIYGVYINDFRAAEGSVVFGGMDAAKLAGEMQVVPLIGRQQFQTDDFIIAWTSFSFTPGTGGAGAGAGAGAGNGGNGGNGNGGNGGNGNGGNGGATDLGGRNLPAVLLDTGNPGLSMPASVLDRIGPAIGITQAPDGTNVVPCNSGDTGARFTFGFGAASIDVPISMLFIPVNAADAQGQALCTLPLDVSDGPVASLGAPLLQAAYAVFDMENNVVGMAQAKVNTTETKIQELRPDWLQGRQPGAKRALPRAPRRRVRLT